MKDDHFVEEMKILDEKPAFYTILTLSKSDFLIFWTIISERRENLLQISKQQSALYTILREFFFIYKSLIRDEDLFSNSHPPRVIAKNLIQLADRPPPCISDEVQLPEKNTAI